MEIPAQTPRRLPWAVATQNLWHSGWMTFGWLLLGVGVIGAFFQRLPPPTPAGWTFPGLAVVGLALVVIRLIAGARANAMLRHAALTRGSLTGIFPTARSAGGVLTVRVSYDYVVNGQTLQAQYTGPASVGLAIKAMDALLGMVAKAIAERAGRQGDTLELSGQPAVQYLRSLSPMELLKRILADGWQAVSQDVLARAVGRTAVDVAAGVALATPSGEQEGESHLTAASTSDLLGKVTTTALDSAHSALGSHFSTTTAVGGAAHRLLDGAHALAAETVQGFLAAQGQELVFYTPGAPDDYLLASSLPYTLSLDARGQLQGGNRLAAVASLLIPILVSVIIGIAVLVKVVYVAVR